MQVRVDDDMRAIVTFTREEYDRFGGDKELVAQGVELTLGAELAGSVAVEEPIAEVVETAAEAPATEPVPEPVTEPVTAVTPEVVTETVPEPETI